MSGFLFILVPVIERIMKSTTRYRKYYSGSLHQKLYDSCHDVNFVSTPTHCFFFITWHIDYLQCRWYCHHNCQIEKVELIYSDDIVKLWKPYTTTTTTTTKARAFSTIHVSRSTGKNIDSAVQNEDGEVSNI